MECQDAGSDTDSSDRDSISLEDGSRDGQKISRERTTAEETAIEEVIENDPDEDSIPENTGKADEEDDAITDDEWDKIEGAQPREVVLEEAEEMDDVHAVEGNDLDTDVNDDGDASAGMAKEKEQREEKEKYKIEREGETSYSNEKMSATEEPVNGGSDGGISSTTTDIITPDSPAANLNTTDELEEDTAQPTTSMPPPPPKTREQLEQEEREKMRVLVSSFSEDQLNRYEMYRRAAFPKAAIKRLVQSISGCSVSQNVIIAISGIAKVFVGEIVEKALDCMEQTKDGESSGPIEPRHVREAVRKLRDAQNMPKRHRRHPYFRR
ncbi:transcription initiation factor TFIID subunit 11-like [Tropilaelaps mercedesae]|uniref:Transcription initiation factor TFIID subunit 11-like n=1 Tax=Tropilaelaps mercedesae TaxID=418985 RepID=A0A1V9XPB6_9ACAR|nr:transcription initiation factor TFIID subunit 11-like [Tropilaelaps mercedesae]